MTDGDREDIAREMKALKELCRVAHEKATDGKVTTACHCACGAGMGGPAGSEACRALRRIRDLFLAIDWDRKLKKELVDEAIEMGWWLL